MKNLLKLILVVFIFSCKEKSEEKAETQLPESNRENKIVYSDEGKSSAEVREHTSKTVNVHYDYLSIWDDGQHSFIAKIATSTFVTFGAMGQQRSIRAELTSLESPPLSKIEIEKDCDILNFTDQYYETIKTGCCGAENELAIYDYSNQLIIQGTSTIVKCEIPNSHLEFFASIYGGIRLSYGPSDQYLVTVRTPKELNDENCGPIPPDIIFESTDSKKIEFDEDSNKYSFWSLNGAKQKDEVNGLIIKVIWICAVKSEPITIPIINGRPFGKDDREQSIDLVLN